MHVAVLGGGLQGCCVALELAARGIRVTLFDRGNSLLNRAAIANEGKVHLGYMYANDPTLATARTMMRGALSFAPFFARHLAIAADQMTLSQPASYVVHRESQRSTEEVAQYLHAAHELLRAEADTRPDCYFGKNLAVPLRQWSTSEIESSFDPEVAVAAFDSPEVAVDPIALACLLRQRMLDEACIDVRLNHEVISVDDSDSRLSVHTMHADASKHQQFDHVVNALWEGRLLIDQRRGLRPIGPWLHRLKYGVSFQIPEAAPMPCSATFVSGPFGEIVSYDSGLIYLTWYPVCLREVSGDIVPPNWETYPPEPLRSELLERTLKAMAAFTPALKAIDVTELSSVVVRGGPIVAWGATDIYDPESELHQRFNIGVTSTGRFHSIDPGKLTMAPYFAEACARRIAEDVN